MKSIEYNDLSFDWVTTHHWEVKPEMTPDGTDWVCNRIDIIVTVVLNPKAQSYDSTFAQNGYPNNIVSGGDNFANVTDSIIRAKLAQPRGDLLVVGVDDTIVLESPQPGRVCDARGGPRVLALGPTKFHSDRTWEYKLHITTWIRECPAQKVLLSNRWQQTMDVSEDSFTTIYTRGTAVFDLGEAKKLAKNPDSYRKFLVPDVPLGFKRSIQVEQSSDGTVVNYTCTDVQNSHGFVSEWVTRIDATQSGHWSQDWERGAHAAFTSATGGVSRSTSRGDIAIAVASAGFNYALSAMPRYVNHIIVRAWGRPNAPRVQLTAAALSVAWSRIKGVLNFNWTVGQVVVTEHLTGKFSEVQMTFSCGINNPVIFGNGIVPNLQPQFTAFFNAALAQGNMSKSQSWGIGSILSLFPHEVAGGVQAGSPIIESGTALPQVGPTTVVKNNYRGDYATELISAALLGDQTATTNPNQPPAVSNSNT